MNTETHWVEVKNYSRTIWLPLPASGMTYEVAPEEAKKSSFFSYKHYRSSTGEPVTVEYCRDLKTSEATARKLLKERVLGLDLEWKPVWGSKKSHGGPKENVSLIQIASPSLIGLFHIARLNGSSITQLIAPSLKLLIESHDILKTGVGILWADRPRLIEHLNLHPGGLTELNDLQWALQDAEASLPTGKKTKKRKQALTLLTDLYTQSPLSKNKKIRCSNWSLPRPLIAAQEEYAASDAYSGLVIYYHIVRRIHEIQLTKKTTTPPFKPKTRQKPRRRSQKSSQTSSSERRATADGELLQSLRKKRTELSKKRQVDDNSIIPDRLLEILARGQILTQKFRKIFVEAKTSPLLLEDSDAFLRIIYWHHCRKLSKQTREHLMSQAKTKEWDQFISMSINKLCSRMSMTHPQTVEALATLGLDAFEATAFGTRLIATMSTYLTSRNVTESPFAELTHAFEDGSENGQAEREDTYRTNLLAFRSSVAGQTKCTVERVASDLTIAEIARIQPSTINELHAVVGIEKLIDAAYLCGLTIEELLQRLSNLDTQKAVIFDMETFLATDDLLWNEGLDRPPEINDESDEFETMEITSAKPPPGQAISDRTTGLLTPAVSFNQGQPTPEHEEPNPTSSLPIRSSSDRKRKLPWSDFAYQKPPAPASKPLVLSQSSSRASSKSGSDYGASDWADEIDMETVELDLDLQHKYAKEIEKSDSDDAFDDDVFDDYDDDVFYDWDGP